MANTNIRQKAIGLSRIWRNISCISKSNFTSFRHQPGDGLGWFINARVKPNPCRSFNYESFKFAPMQLDMPALSPTMEVGTIVQWLVKEGESVEAGDALCEIETDKAVVSMEAMEPGILAEILVPEGSKDIVIGTPIAIMREEGEDISGFVVSTTNVPVIPTQEEPVHKEDTMLTKMATQTFRLSPAVKHLVNMYKINPSEVTATGPKGLLLKGDLLSFIQKKNLMPQQAESLKLPIQGPLKTPSPDATSMEGNVAIKSSETNMSKPSRKTETFVDLELSGMRKTIAKRLTQSKADIPHNYSSIDCKVDEILVLRKKLKEGDIKISVNDFIIKAAACALKETPQVNAIWQTDDVIPVNEIDISIAVATNKGLITPIVKNADCKGLNLISTSVKELSERAKTGKLKPEEYQGGSFTISNLGMFNIKDFTAVINPPQVCIMAVGGSRIVPNRDSKMTVMTVTLSCDARAIDEETAHSFLGHFKKFIENPMHMV